MLMVLSHMLVVLSYMMIVLHSQQPLFPKSILVCRVGARQGQVVVNPIQTTHQTLGTGDEQTLIAAVS